MEQSLEDQEKRERPPSTNTGQCQPSSHMANRKRRCGKLAECCAGSHGRVRMNCSSVVDSADIIRSHHTSSPAEQGMQTAQGATEGFGFWNARKRSQLERFDASHASCILTN